MEINNQKFTILPLQMQLPAVRTLYFIIISATSTSAIHTDPFTMPRNFVHITNPPLSVFTPYKRKSSLFN